MTITNPDWVPPIEITFDEGKPIRSEQGLMLAGNPIAMALLKPGAPIPPGEWVPYNAAVLHDGATGLIYDHAVTNDVAVVNSPSFAAGWSYAVTFEGVQGSNSGTTDFNVTLTGPSIDILKLSSTPNVNIIEGRAEIVLPELTNGRRNYSSYGYTTAGGGGTASNAPTGIDSASAATAFSLAYSGGNITAGQIYMWKRRDYV